MKNEGIKEPHWDKTPAGIDRNRIKDEVIKRAAMRYSSSTMKGALAILDHAMDGAPSFEYTNDVLTAALEMYVAYTRELAKAAGLI